MNEGARETNVDDVRAAGDAAQEATLCALQGHLFLTDAHGCVRSLNRALVGDNAASCVGARLEQLVAASQRRIVCAALQQVRDGAPSVELDVRLAATGRWYRLRAAAVRERGVVSGLAVHAVDIDDYKRNETEAIRLRAGPRRVTGVAGAGRDAAAKIERRFEAMADALPVLISYVDKERRYQFNNVAYERWFGRSRDELRGRDMESVLGTEAYEQIRGYVDAALSGRAVSFELTLPYRDAGVRHVVAHYVPDVTASGAIAGFHALIDDMTERWKAEAALRQRDEEIRQLQKMEALGRLAGTVAHDFANLLHAVGTCCDVALLTTPDGQPERKELLRIKRVVEDGACLTRQLLSIGCTSDQPLVPLDVDAVLGDMRPLLERVLGRRIEVGLALGARATIKADPQAIQRLLLNLAMNARDAMPHGGRLHVSSGCVDAGFDSARHDVLAPGRYVRIAVTDTGVGMDSSTAARIFEPFFTTKLPGTGTGLGLSSVYGIVQTLGGHIEVRSRPAAGTTFNLYLPCVESAAPPP